MDRSALEESESRFASFVESLNAVIGDRAVGVRSSSALRSLRAYYVLREFLALRREISDPVERTGEDAVINAVALKPRADTADGNLKST